MKRHNILISVVTLISSLIYSISDLGSGSDHTGFYHRHGITSMDVVYYYDKVRLHKHILKN